MRFAAVCAYCLVALVSPAAADQPAPDDPRARADALVAEGSELGRTGDLPGAIAKFKAAERHVPRAVHQCNIGLAYARLGDWPRTELFLSRCREQWAREESRPLEPWVDQRIRGALAAMRGNGFAPVRITTEPAGAELRVSSFADDEAFTARVIWLPHGQHTIAASAPGRAPTSRTVDVSGDARIDLTIELAMDAPTPSNAAVEPTLEPNQPAEAEPPVDAVGASPDASDGGAPAMVTAVEARPAGAGTMFYVASGVGLAGLFGGGVAHTLALSSKTKAEEAASPSAFRRYDQKFVDRRNVAIGLYAVGAVGLGVGTYLWLTRPRTSGASLSLAPRRGGATATVGWRF